MMEGTGSRRGLAWLAAAALAAGPLAASFAQDTGQKAAQESREPVPETKAQTPATRIYVPPSRGMSKARVGGATRSSRGLPPLRALAPEEVGLTRSAQPTLYWFTPSEIQARVDFTLIDETSVAPLLEVTLPGPFPPGIHAVALERHEVRLDEGRLYQWYVAAIDDPERRSGDRIAGAAIWREAAAPELEQRLTATEGAQRYRVLAEGGLWYDAFDALSRRIAEAPGDVALHEDRARLLEEVNLLDAGAFARGLATASATGP